ncbi:MAG: PspA/IM30 family protein, partial [Isosphaeraceae bacterium]
MRHLKGAVWTERLLLVLIVASMAGTLNLVIAVHRRVRAIEADRTRPKAAVSDVKPPRPVLVAAPRPVLVAAPRPVPAPPPPPAKPAEDPTVAILARIDRVIAREVEAAQEADRRAEAHEAAIRRSEAESQRWKRREMLVRQQVAALDRHADKAEIEVATLDAERDVLERERDILKAATAKASQRTGYAILPYKGPNGTWRRPIVLECSGDAVKLQPSGRVFTALELSPLINPRVSPLVLAIAREMLHIQQSDTPDGAPAVPYLVFMVRPDGIRPYYRLRERLEPLGVAFGYELIEQDLAVNIPNLDDLTTWDGSVPLDSPELAALEASRRRLAATQGQDPPKEPEKDAAGQSPADRVAA